MRLATGDELTCKSQFKHHFQPIKLSLQTGVFFHDAERLLSLSIINVAILIGCSKSNALYLFTNYFYVFINC